MSELPAVIRAAGDLVTTLRADPALLVATVSVVALVVVGFALRVILSALDKR